MDPGDYWLGHCEGFRVESSKSRIGLVDAIVHAVPSERPDALVVRAGVLGRRVVVVPVGEVAEIRPRQKTLILRTSPPSRRDALTDPLRRLRRGAGQPLPR
jgi:hypothetical protein